MTRILQEKLVTARDNVLVYQFFGLKTISLFCRMILNILQVVEVVSGDCIVVADDSQPFGSPLAERRVNLSSIKCPRLGNPRRDGQSNDKPNDKLNPGYAREAKDFLRTRLIGRQVLTLIFCNIIKSFAVLMSAVEESGLGLTICII